MKKFESVKNCYKHCTKPNIKEQVINLQKTSMFKNHTRNSKNVFSLRGSVKASFNLRMDSLTQLPPCLVLSPEIEKNTKPINEYDKIKDLIWNFRIQSDSTDPGTLYIINSTNDLIQELLSVALSDNNLRVLKTKLDLKGYNNKFIKRIQNREYGVLELCTAEDQFVSSGPKGLLSVVKRKGDVMLLSHFLGRLAAIIR